MQSIQRKPVFDRKVLVLISCAVILDVFMVKTGTPETLDMKLYYTGEQARMLLSGFSPHAIHAYLVNEIFDFALILTYTLTSILLLTRLYPKKILSILLAITPGIFDMIETSFIVHALKTHVNQNYFDWLGTVTFLKWMTGLISVTFIIYGFFRKIKFNSGAGVNHLVDQQERPMQSSSL